MVDAGKSIQLAANVGAANAPKLKGPDADNIKSISAILGNAGKGENYSPDGQTVAAIGEHRSNPGALSEAIS